MNRINTEQLGDRIIIDNMPSELRPLADAYNAMMDKLEHNFAPLSRFSDDIAHELRIPLAILGTQTQVMLSKPRDRSEYIEQLHDQSETIEQLSGLINNMLLLAKTQKGLYDSQFTAVNVEALITKMIGYYELIAEDKGILLEKNGNFESVLGDDPWLQRMFANLISNAVYYAANNSVITITASIINRSTLNGDEKKMTTDLRPYLNIVFTNQLAAPLTQTETDKLSERFYRHHKQNTMHSGTGLGLSIVQAVIDAHNEKMDIIVKDNYCFNVNVCLPISDKNPKTKN
ncbi:ATP-binding protein [Psychrobacter alimentarius]|uniref:ATP-binding protein n=1 Tax=Psychrobacter alimentarius TaxID=261164 RepID=UPI001D11B265|nr:ATP-binding protein [Psychrobacter alimentarius]